MHDQTTMTMTQEIFVKLHSQLLIDLSLTHSRSNGLKSSASFSAQAVFTEDTMGTWQPGCCASMMRQDRPK